MIIAIDGPAGSGKTTVAKLLAKKLNILYLDTGATYRALTLKALNNNIDLGNELKLMNLANKLDIKLENERIYLDGEDVTEKIREPLIDRNISKPVSLAGVRDEMVNLQREIVKGKDAVVEGRDITTVVFPKAEYKFYLDASLRERANRRYKELEAKGIEVVLPDVEKQMKDRDLADLTRSVGPLKKSKDAIYVDTTGLEIEEALNTILGYIKK